MTDRPAKTLLDPALHKDSCGFGLIANLDDLPSHWVIETAIEALARLTHRGAVAATARRVTVAVSLSNFRSLSSVLWEKTVASC
jgi:glutamate synthase domain-containing protein 1